MQPFLRDFVADAVALLAPPDPVVEFGALQVETGQDADLRPLFAGRPFVGTDLRAGPGVDRVEDLRALSFGDGSVGTAVCLETLEHCEDPFAAGRELARVTAPEGLCLVSTPFLLGIHGYPQDFWRFTPEGMKVVLGGFAHVWTGAFGDPEAPLAVVAIARHGAPLGDVSLPRLQGWQARFESGDGRVRVGPFLMGRRELVRALLRRR